HRPEDYRWSSYARYLGGKDDLVPVEPDRVLKLVSENPKRCGSSYQRFVEDGLNTHRTSSDREGVSRIAAAATAALAAAGIPPARGLPVEQLCAVPWWKGRLGPR